MDEHPRLEPIPSLPSNTDAVGRVLRTVLSVGPVLLAAVLVWLYWDQIWTLVRDQEALQRYVATLGWWGPLALIGLNIVQIVVAPIPGYGVYIVAGYLFDWFWGGVWGTVGMLAGAMAAMWLARRFGRPIVVRLIGAERLENWEQVTHSDSTLVWTAILLSPVGDTPYLLAGLARVGFTKIFILTFITRAPAAFAAAAVGAGAMTFQWWQLALIVLVFALPLMVYSRCQERINAWIRQRTAQSNE